MNTIKLPTKDQTNIKQNTLKNHLIALKIIIINKFSLSICLAHPKMQYLIFKIYIELKPQ